MPALPKEEIFKSVKQTLVDALSVEDDEVTEDATLTSDLGAESIDFLDIVFRLEKTFSIKIPQDELIPRDILSNPDYVNDRKLNEAGVKALKESMPHADFSGFEQDPDINKMAELFRVQTITKYVLGKVNE